MRHNKQDKWRDQINTFLMTLLSVLTKEFIFWYHGSASLLLRTYTQTLLGCKCYKYKKR